MAPLSAGKGADLLLRRAAPPLLRRRPSIWQRRIPSQCRSTCRALAARHFAGRDDTSPEHPPSRMAPWTGPSEQKRATEGGVRRVRWKAHNKESDVKETRLSGVLVYLRIQQSVPGRCSQRLQEPSISTCVRSELHMYLIGDTVSGDDTRYCAIR
eukprot:644770-Rhodomonas_salina.1